MTNTVHFVTWNFKKIKNKYSLKQEIIFKTTALI